MYLYLLSAVQSLYQESASFLFIIEEEHLQQHSNLSFYKMLFITGKLLSACTSHANKNFI